LIGCLAVLIGKRLTPAPGLLALMAVMLVIVLLSTVRRGQLSISRRFVWLCMPVLWIAWAGMTVDWYAAAHCRHPVVLKADRPVACFGDSMTSLGVSGGYPGNLQALISLPVVNLGIGGISAKQTVEEQLLKAAHLNPQVVVIELGGHDFLNGYSRASTKSYLKKIIDSMRQIDAEVVLMEIPRAFISDPYWGLEREIAREEDIELVSDSAMRRIFLRSTAFPPGTWLGEPYLTDESGIHPNQRGKQILAEHVAEALDRMYGPRIRRH
jgi:lysophospholipase L1-like esterase